MLYPKQRRAGPAANLFVVRWSVLSVGGLGRVGKREVVVVWLGLGFLMLLMDLEWGCVRRVKEERRCC